MRIRSVLGTLTLGVILSSCVFSVDPVIPESEGRFDPRLLGVWEEVSGSDRAVVSRSAGNLYGIEYTNDRKTRSFAGRLGQLAGRQVLDIWPAAAANPDVNSYLLVPGHLLVSVEIDSSTLRIAGLERDSVLAALTSPGGQLPYTISGDVLVVHGSTKDVRIAFERLLRSRGGLGEMNVWRRARSR